MGRHTRINHKAVRVQFDYTRRHLKRLDEIADASYTAIGQRANVIRDAICLLETYFKFLESGYELYAIKKNGRDKVRIYIPSYEVSRNKAQLKRSGTLERRVSH